MSYSPQLSLRVTLGFSKTSDIISNYLNNKKKNSVLQDALIFLLLFFPNCHKSIYHLFLYMYHN